MKDLVERKIGDLTIRIDRTLCVGTSNCMKVAPEVFEFDDENICAFKANTPDIERERLIDACVDSFSSTALRSAEGKTLEGKNGACWFYRASQ